MPIYILHIYINKEKINGCSKNYRVATEDLC